MVDVDAAYLTSQQELLREIRDELRMTRSQTAASVGGGGGTAPMGGRAGSTYTQFQAAADRTMLGNWNTLGWSNAYKHLYQSSYTGDLLGALGLNRAPESMTQLEYQATARQSLGYRTANVVGNLIAPDYTEFSNQLTSSIYKNSQRFIRAGSPLAGAFGPGLSLTNSARLASTVNQMALGDSRLSMADYSNIVDTGMRTNQFNDVGSQDDFIKRTKELAEATATLTRAMHMSVGEITQVMGNLRTVGIQSVGQQASLIKQMGALGAVAGMSGSEMLQFTGTFAESMLPTGVNAAASMQLAAVNAATVRNASSWGLVSQNAIAQGGGALQVAQNISRTQLGFAASMPGYLAMRGGGARGGANTFNAMIGGLAGYKTGEDLLGMELDRAEAMDTMSGQDAETLFRNQIFSNLEMIGLDPDSRAGQGQAFRQLTGRYGMEAGAARAWIGSNISAGGRRASEVTQMNAIRQTEAQNRRDEQDRYFSRFSFVGGIHSGVQRFESVIGGAFDSVRTGIMGYGDTGFDAQQRNLSIYAAQAGAGGMSAVDRGLAIKNLRDNPTTDEPTSIVMRNRNVEDGSALLYGATKVAMPLAMGAGGALAIAGGLGAWTGGAFGAGAAVAAVPFAVPILAGAAVVGASYLAYQGLTSAFGNNTTTKDPVEVARINKMLNAKRRANPNRGEQFIKDRIAKGLGFKGEDWDKLKGMSTDWTYGDTMIEGSNRIAAIAADNNVSTQDVMDAYSYVGGGPETGEAITLNGGKFYASAEGQAAIKEALGENNWWGRNRVTTNVASSAGAMQNYIDSVISKGKAGDIESGELRKALGTNASFEAFKANIAGMSREQQVAASTGFKTTKLTVEREMLTASEESSKNFLLSRLDSAAGMKEEDRRAIRDSFANLKRGDLNEFLESDKMKPLVASGAFGETAKQVLNVASNEELAKMSSEQVHKKYGVRFSDWDEAVKKTPDQLREAVRGTMWDTAAAKAEKAAENSEAALLNKTAHILERIMGDLNAGVIKNAADES